jgi:hypothetical protein
MLSSTLSSPCSLPDTRPHMPASVCQLPCAGACVLQPQLCIRTPQLCIRTLEASGDTRCMHSTSE